MRGAVRGILAPWIIALACSLMLPGPAPASDAPASPRPKPTGPAGEDEKTGIPDRLRSLGYTAWDTGSDLGLRGVTRHDRTRTAPGYNLYTDNHNKIFLVDMEGDRVHQWDLGAFRLNCEHAEFLPGGSIVAVCMYDSLAMLDWKSNILWDLDLDAHHDVAVRSDGQLVVPYTDYRPYKGRTVNFDGIATVSGGGKVLDRWSTLEHLEMLKKYHRPSELDEPAVAGEPDPAGARPRYDYYHLNTVEILPETDLGRRDRRFRAGNLMLCLRNANLIVILDQETREVVWHWGVNDLELPHMPALLDSGRILIFDNGAVRRYSRVIEVDPLTKQIVWEYVADPPKSFFSEGRGSSQRLENGNTLICESERGRAFEVTPSGEIVWEFWNPEIKLSKRKRIYRFVRLAPSEVEPLLRGRPALPKSNAPGEIPER